MNKKFFTKIVRKLPLIMGIGILAMDLIALSAPIFAHIGWDGLAQAIYFVYSFLCHQRPWRSIHIFDYQMAWCTRDTFIYLSMGLAAIFVVLFKLRKFKWYIALLSLIPFALDGVIQMIAEISGTLNGDNVFFYASTNFFRMLTGSIFGAGAGLWLFSMLDETLNDEYNPLIKEDEEKGKKQTKKNNMKRNLLAYIGILAICLFSYLALVQIWDSTSEKYKPHGLLDHEQIFPGHNYEDTGEKHVP